MTSLINSVHKRLIDRIEKLEWSLPHHSVLMRGLGVVGAVTALSASVSACGFVYNHFLRPFPALGARYGKGWAVISGGTAGIGYEIAKILAKEGVNVVLLARDQQRLDETAIVLKQINPSVSVLTVSCDAASANYDVLRQSLDGLDVSLLVNNVGVHNDIPTNVEDLSREEIDRIISVNCNFQVNLTSLLIPQLKKHQRAAVSGGGYQRHAATTVLNVSSLTSQMAMPLLSVYAGSKAFEEHWSACLAAELAPDHIEVMCVRPGLTVSRMSGISEPSLFCPSAADMARSILHKVGLKQLSIAPYWPHALLDWINQLVPERVAGEIVRKMHQKKRDELVKAN